MIRSRREVEVNEISDLVVYQMGSISIRPLLTFVVVVLYYRSKRHYFSSALFLCVFYRSSFLQLSGAKLFCPERISDVDLSCSRNDSTFKRLFRRSHVMPCSYKGKEKQNWQLWAEVTVNVWRTL